MQQRPSQYRPGHEIPETTWVYRFAKKHWFSDFGAYEQAGLAEPKAGNGKVG